VSKHKEISTADVGFLRSLESWLREQPEILILMRYSSAAGSKDWEFFSSFSKLHDRLRGLQARTSVIAFRKRQLPLRGVVDDNFIAHCLRSIPDGTEYLLVETVPSIAGKASWFHDAAGMSHSELRQDLEDSRGLPVAVGPYPDWFKDSDDVISAIVPDKDGAVVLGIY
jgi:hypothetical protein